MVNLPIGEVEYILRWIILFVFHCTKFKLFHSSIYFLLGLEIIRLNQTRIGLIRVVNSWFSLKYGSNLLQIFF
jgi:hypothetical protein